MGNRYAYENMHGQSWWIIFSLILSLRLWVHWSIRLICRLNYWGPKSAYLRFWFEGRNKGVIWPKASCHSHFYKMRKFWHCLTFNWRRIQQFSRRCSSNVRNQDITERSEVKKSNISSWNYINYILHKIIIVKPFAKLAVEWQWSSWRRQTRSKQQDSGIKFWKLKLRIKNLFKVRSLAKQ